MLQIMLENGLDHVQWNLESDVINQLGVKSEEFSADINVEAHAHLSILDMSDMSFFSKFATILFIHFF